MVAMVAMVTDFIFFISFSMDIGWAWVADHFGVLHDILYSLFDAWYHKKLQKCPKIAQNWPFYDRFMVAMVTEFIFFIIFLFDLVEFVILLYYMTYFELLVVARSKKMPKMTRISLSYQCLGNHGNQILVTIVLVLQFWIQDIFIIIYKLFSMTYCGL